MLAVQAGDGTISRHSRLPMYQVFEGTPREAFVHSKRMWLFDAQAAG